MYCLCFNSNSVFIAVRLVLGLPMRKTAILKAGGRFVARLFPPFCKYQSFCYFCGTV